MPKPTGDAARGREAVESALIEAACDLLAELGPRATTVRDIAARAGVNHAQVHHYFGGKRALLCQAMEHMARQHHEAMRALAPGKPVPPPLSLPEDRRYWWATVRATIEGDLELAGIEIGAGVSVIRDVLNHVTARFGLDEPTLDIKIPVAEMAAMQMGWLALERFIFLAADIKPEEEDEVRERVRQSMARHRVQPPDAVPFYSRRPESLS